MSGMSRTIRPIATYFVVYLYKFEYQIKTIEMHIFYIEREKGKSRRDDFN